MIFQNRLLDSDELAALKPQTGDVVVFNNEKYIAEAVGLRYINLCRLDDPKQKCFARITLVTKYEEPIPEPLPCFHVPLIAPHRTKRRK